MYTIWWVLSHANTHVPLQPRQLFLLFQKVPLWPFRLMPTENTVLILITIDQSSCSFTSYTCNHRICTDLYNTLLLRFTYIIACICCLFFFLDYYLIVWIYATDLFLLLLIDIGVVPIFMDILSFFLSQHLGVELCHDGVVECLTFEDT